MERRGVSPGRGGPPSPMSPMTFRRRPSTRSPTGAVIGAPVIRACMSRERPCVGCSAIVRKCLVLKCACTSHTTAEFSGSIIMASLIAGSAPSQARSITGPRMEMTLAIRSGKPPSQIRRAQFEPSYCMRFNDYKSITSHHARKCYTKWRRMRLRDEILSEK